LWAEGSHLNTKNSMTTVSFVPTLSSHHFHISSRYLHTPSALFSSPLLALHEHLIVHATRACGSGQTSDNVMESAYCSRYCTYLMLNVSYLGSTIVALLSLPCTFLVCYTFLFGYLYLSSLIAFSATLVPIRQPYTFLLSY